MNVACDGNWTHLILDCRDFGGLAWYIVIQVSGVSRVCLYNVSLEVHKLMKVACCVQVHSDRSVLVQDAWNMSSPVQLAGE